MKTRKGSQTHLNWSLFFALSTSLTLPVATLADEAPDPNAVRVIRAEATGNGCRPGTYAATLSPDATSLTLLFDDFQAKAGEGGAPIDRKTCNIDIDLDLPEGWSFTLLNAEYRGFADLTAGAQAIHTVGYRFVPARGRGAPPPGAAAGRGRDFRMHTFRGPFSDNYTVETSLPIDSGAHWKTCGGIEPLRIQTSLSTSVPGDDLQKGVALMTLDSVDGRLEQKFRVGWKRCSGSPGHNGGPGKPPAPVIRPTPVTPAPLPSPGRPTVKPRPLPRPVPVAAPEHTAGGLKPGFRKPGP
jgi:hypothetical protein